MIIFNVLGLFAAMIALFISVVGLTRSILDHRPTGLHHLAVVIACIALGYNLSVIVLYALRAVGS